MLRGDAVRRALPARYDRAEAGTGSDTAVQAQGKVLEAKDVFNSRGDMLKTVPFRTERKAWELR